MVIFGKEANPGCCTRPLTNADTCYSSCTLQSQKDVCSRCTSATVLHLPGITGTTALSFQDMKQV